MEKSFFYCEKCTEEVLIIDIDHNACHIRCGGPTYLYKTDPQVDYHLERVKRLQEKYKAINEQNKK